MNSKQEKSLSLSSIYSETETDGKKMNRKLEESLRGIFLIYHETVTKTESEQEERLLLRTVYSETET